MTSLSNGCDQYIGAAAQFSGVKRLLGCRILAPKPACQPVIQDAMTLTDDRRCDGRNSLLSSSPLIAP
jgi:hypothetical protein